MNTRSITITSVTNGYIVKVGCQTFVKEDTDQMMKELTAYLHNPDMVEAEYAKEYGFDLCLTEPEATRARTALETVMSDAPSENCASA